jgi:outer membrane murein-binding lipoprotein Lpp
MASSYIRKIILLAAATAGFILAGCSSPERYDDGDHLATKLGDSLARRDKLGSVGFLSQASSEPKRAALPAWPQALYAQNTQTNSKQAAILPTTARQSNFYLMKDLTLDSKLPTADLNILRFDYAPIKNSPFSNSYLTLNQFDEEQSRANLRIELLKYFNLKSLFILADRINIYKYEQNTLTIKPRIPKFWEWFNSSSKEFGADLTFTLRW